MFKGNWSAKLEYLHYDLGSATYGTTVSNFAVAGAPVPGWNSLYTLGQTSSTSFRGDIIRVGLELLALRRWSRSTDLIKDIIFRAPVMLGAFLLMPS